jgi:putative Mg2+ transporter-C (MgtC) family protein
MGLSTSINWTEIALRLALTTLVGIVIGYNRSEHGKAAGMRTTLLVCLAASVAMIQVNLLLPTAGRASDSFVMNDLMRLPLGILTGVGFIGAGAILRRDNIVLGVTTAATLWLVTVIGLCIGGGQIALGLVATLLGLFALWVLPAVENLVRQDRRGRLSIELHAGGPAEAEIQRLLKNAGLTVTGSRVTARPASNQHEFVFNVIQRRRIVHTEGPAVIDELLRLPGVVTLQWDGLR